MTKDELYKMLTEATAEDAELTEKDNGDGTVTATVEVQTDPSKKDEPPVVTPTGDAALKDGGKGDKEESVGDFDGDGFEEIKKLDCEALSDKARTNAIILSCYEKPKARLQAQEALKSFWNDAVVKAESELGAKIAEVVKAGSVTEEVIKDVRTALEKVRSEADKAKRKKVYDLCAKEVRTKIGELLTKSVA